MTNGFPSHEVLGGVPESTPSCPIHIRGKIMSKLGNGEHPNITPTGR